MFIGGVEEDADGVAVGTEDAELMSMAFLLFLDFAGFSVEEDEELDELEDVDDDFAEADFEESFFASVRPTATSESSYVFPSNR